MSIGPKKRFEIFERDGFTCKYCGKHAGDTELHVDYIIPRARGGSDNHNNLTTSCVECHTGKRAKVTLCPPGMDDLLSWAAWDCVCGDDFISVKKYLIAAWVIEQTAKHTSNKEATEAITGFSQGILRALSFRATRRTGKDQ